MVNGNPDDFLETVYNGTSLEYSYNGRVFFTESYWADNQYWMVTYHCDDEGNDEDYLIKRAFSLDEDVVDYYVNAPIFEGKTFWEAEKDIEWLY